MGKQIGLFFTVADEQNIYEIIETNKYSIMNDLAVVLKGQEINASQDMSFFISYIGSEIFLSGKYIDPMKSSVIHFSRCKSWQPNTLTQGRLWAEFKYWDSNGEYVSKPAQLTEMYNTLSRWIKKTCKRSVCGYYYIAEDAYKMYKAGDLLLVTGPKTTADFD